MSFSLQGFILFQLGYLSFLKNLHAVAYHISRMTLLDDIFHHRISQILIGKRHDITMQIYHKLVSIHEKYYASPLI